MNRIELAAWLRLLLTPGVGRATARKLLAAFHSPVEVFEQTVTALSSVISGTLANAVKSEPIGWEALVDVTWAWLCTEADSHRLLTLGDPLYPKQLLETEDPPLLLYAIGAPFVWSGNLLNSDAHPCIAVVGSRNPTPQGTINAQLFGRSLAQAGVTIVSGLALGVDGAAHEGALEGALGNALATIAVVGTGLDRIYPRQHHHLAHQIAARGVILSEYPLGTSPVASNFPQRNRIISGLSKGTLVVEAAMQSGSLITARLAAEQGREVFAIPGSIHATQSRGCHSLIKQGAKLVECAQDVLEELQLVPDRAATHDTGATASTPAISETDDGPSAKDGASPLERALGFDAVGLDTLQARTGLPTPDLLAQLMNMELQGYVARLPGGLFQRVYSA